MMVANYGDHVLYCPLRTPQPPHWDCVAVYITLPSSLLYKTHLSRQLNCWSLRCSWSIACRRCSNYIFILNLTPGFNRLGKDKCKIRWESFKFCDLVRLILQILWYMSIFLMAKLPHGSCVSLALPWLSVVPHWRPWWHSQLVALSCA